MKNDINEDLKNTECSNLEVMVFRIELTYIETGYKFDIKFIGAKTIGYTL